MDIKYNYANKLRDHERNDFWRSLSSERDIEHAFGYAEKLVESLSDPSKTQKVYMEDYRDMESCFGKMEIAYRRTRELPHLFSYTEDDRVNFFNRYSACIDKSGHVAQRLISN